MDIPYQESTMVDSSVPKNSLNKFHLGVALLGTIIEYFDYALYGFCAATLAQHFFAGDDPKVNLIKAFGIFAAGSLAKPVGSLFFGWFGDTYGRRLSLQISMIGIAFPTFIIALLPGYHQWGLAAPIILLGCRIAQGFFVAGESDGVRVFVLESVPSRYACFAATLVSTCCFLGIYIASRCVSIVHEFDTSLEAWRFLFLGGASAGIIIVILRQFISESIEYSHYKQQENIIPTSFRNLNWRGVGTAFCICGAVGGTYHIISVFLPSYLSQILHVMDYAQATALLSRVLLVYMVTLPLAGLCADYIGAQRQFFAAGCFLLGLLSIIILMGGSYFLDLIFLLCIDLAFFQAPGVPLVAKQFHVSQRYRGLSLGHGIGSAMFSGTAPAFCTWATYATGFMSFPLVHMIFLVLLGLCGLIFVKDSLFKSFKYSRSS